MEQNLTLLQAAIRHGLMMLILILGILLMFYSSIVAYTVIIFGIAVYFTAVAGWCPITSLFNYYSNKRNKVQAN